MWDAPFRLGPYDVHARLGSGGFATVYRASIAGDMGFRRAVAIKVLHPHISQDQPYLVTLLADEARLLARMDHPNIVSVSRFGELEAPGGRRVHAIVMEYVAGASLGEMLRVLRNRGRRLPLIEVLGLLKQLAEALAYAHELTDKGGEPLHLIHRDLKPANVLVTATGHLKLLDFGIAKVKDRLAETTRSDSIRGTLRYMSPEQLAGRTPLDHRSDLFSFGAIAYELAMGERMIGGGLMTDALRTLLRFDPSAWLDRAAQVDEPLSDLLACLLGPAAVDRPEHSQEVVDALTGLLAARGGPPPGLAVTAKLAAAILESRDRIAPAPEACATPP